MSESPKRRCLGLADRRANRCGMNTATATISTTRPLVGSGVILGVYTDGKFLPAHKSKTKKNPPSDESPARALLLVARGGLEVTSLTGQSCRQQVCLD